MKNGVIVLLSFLVIGVAGYLYMQDGFSEITDGHCRDFKEVGEFSQKINSESDVEKIVLDFYFSQGYNLNSENLLISPRSNGWKVLVNAKTVDADGVEVCLLEDYSGCIGEILLEEGKIIVNQGC